MLYYRSYAASYAMAVAKLNGQHLLRRKWWSRGDGGYFYYRGKRHYSRGTAYYRQLTTADLEAELRGALQTAISTD